MDNPTNGELAVMLNGHGQKLDTVIVQVMKTNGRVTELEKAGWMLKGGLAVLIVLVVPLLLDFASKTFGK